MQPPAVNCRIVNAEEPNENCWDMPTTEEFKLDVILPIFGQGQNGVEDIESMRHVFLERSRQESQQAIEREHAEMDEAVSKLKDMESNGGLLDVLDQQVESKSPRDVWARERSVRSRVSPRESYNAMADEGIEGIVEPESTTPITSPPPGVESEVFTEADLLKSLATQQQPELRQSYPSAPILPVCEPVSPLEEYRNYPIGGWNVRPDPRRRVGPTDLNPRYNAMNGIRPMGYEWRRGCGVMCSLQYERIRSVPPSHGMYERAGIPMGRMPRQDAGYM